MRWGVEHGSVAVDSQPLEVLVLGEEDVDTANVVRVVVVRVAGAWLSSLCIYNFKQSDRHLYKGDPTIKSSKLSPSTSQAATAIPKPSPI